MTSIVISHSQFGVSPGCSVYENYFDVNFNNLAVELIERSDVASDLRIIRRGEAMPDNSVAEGPPIPNPIDTFQNVPETSLGL